MQLLGWSTAVCLLSLSVSCDRADIIRTYKPDLTPLASIDTSKDIEISRLPTPTNKYAIDGVNTSSNRPQPDGIRDWYEYEVPASTQHRHVTVNLRVFDNGDSAARFLDSMSRDSWYRPQVEKFTRGTMANGIEYCASYILQHRADPEGCSRPIDSYSSFLLFRSGNWLVSIDVLERVGTGVASSDIDYVMRLLE